MVLKENSDKKSDKNKQISTEDEEETSNTEKDSKDDDETSRDTNDTGGDADPLLPDSDSNSGLPPANEKDDDSNDSKKSLESSNDSNERGMSPIEQQEVVFDSGIVRVLSSRGDEPEEDEVEDEEMENEDEQNSLPDIEMKNLSSDDEGDNMEEHLQELMTQPTEFEEESDEEDEGLEDEEQEKSPEFFSDNFSKDIISETKDVVVNNVENDDIEAVPDNFNSVSSVLVSRNGEDVDSLQVTEISKNSADQIDKSESNGDVECSSPPSSKIIQNGSLESSDPTSQFFKSSSPCGKLSISKLKSPSKQISPHEENNCTQDSKSLNITQKNVNDGDVCSQNSISDEEMPSITSEKNISNEKRTSLVRVIPFKYEPNSIEDDEDLEDESEDPRDEIEEDVSIHEDGIIEEGMCIM